MTFFLNKNIVLNCKKYDSYDLCLFSSIKGMFLHKFKKIQNFKDILKNYFSLLVEVSVSKQMTIYSICQSNFS